MKIVDTNYLVRLFTGVPEVQRTLVLNELKNASNNSIQIPGYVFSELVYVLEFHESLNFSRSEIVAGIHKILDHPAWNYDEELHTKAFELYGAVKLDYADCLVVAEYKLSRAKSVLSFDKKLLKQL